MNEIRLIDANALKEKFPELWNYEADYSIFKQIETLIDEAPTVEQKEFEQILQPIKVNIPEDIKDKLIEEMSKPRKVTLDEVKSTNDCIIAYGDGFESARRLFERPQGKWKYKIDGFHSGGFDYCSICNFPTPIYLEKPNFCPNCGADMRKGESE